MAIPASHEFYWQSLAQLSSGRVYHTLVEARGQLYVMGGYDETGHPTSALEVYCPETDQWDSLPPMPTPRAGAAVAVLGKQLLVVGGVGKDQCPLKTVEIYNTEEGRWKKRSSLREAAMGISIIVKDGRAFAVGGMGADLLPQSHLQQYDLRKDVWAVLPLMPTPRYDTNAHLLGSKIYVSGQREVLDSPLSNQQSSKSPDEMFPSSGHSSAGSDSTMSASSLSMDFTPRLVSDNSWHFNFEIPWKRCHLR